MKVINKLKERAGSSYIDVIIVIFIGCMCLALIVQVFPGLVLKYQLGSFADDVSRIISVEGAYNDETRNAIEDFRLSSKIGNVNVSLNGTEFISGTEKIQLNDLIVVDVTTTYDLGFFSFGSFPINLSSKAESRSEVYWK